MNDLKMDGVVLKMDKSQYLQNPLTDVDKMLHSDLHFALIRFLI